MTNNPTSERTDTERRMLDIHKPEHGVQVQIRGDERVLWVHVDGITVLRISAIPDLELEVMPSAAMDAEEDKR